MRLEAGCYLQSQWDSMVLSEMKEVKDLQATQLLLSPEGPVEKFLKGPASPFTVKSADRGHYAKKVFEESLPFDPSFFSFLRQRETSKALMMKNSYIVSVKGFPGEANRGARSLPQRTLLQLQCGGNTQALEIFSYPKPTQTFQWVPNSCDDVFFQMEIGDLILKKKYSGPLAFPQFLQDFQGGLRTFYPHDFPVEKAALERMGIQSLRVRYEIGGDQLAVRKFTALPKQAPARIVRCWDQ
jgi:type VI secretion system protein ImpL